MKSDSGASGKSGERINQSTRRHVAPFWNSERRHRPAILKENTTCRTVIIGGGIAGLAVGYGLTKAGASPVIIDAGFIGEGSTGWCGGILSSSTTIDLQLVEEAFGKADAIKLFSAVADAVSECKQAFADVDWQSGSSLYLAAKDSHRKILQSEMESKEHYGMPMRLCTKGAIEGSWKGFAGGLESEGEHAAHPVKLIDAISSAISAAGGRIFEQTAMSAWRHENEKFIVKANGCTITADNLILCCGLQGSQNAELKEYEKLLMPASGHILVTRPSQDVIDLVKRTNVIASWDTLNLYHYVRYMADGRMLVGGEEAVGSIPAKALTERTPQIKHLHRWAQEHHSFQIPQVECAWKASLIIPADGLPIIKTQTLGAKNRLVSVITDGLPFAMVLGKSVSELLTTGESWLASLLDGKRPAPLSSKILNLMPTSSLVRRPAYRAAFLALRLYDALC